MSGNANLRILLVDDSEANRILFAAFLKDFPCLIDIARNGQIGLELFRAHHYDLVLMDVEMPVMGGEEAVRGIRLIEEQTGVSPAPVLALTAHTLAKLSRRANNAGFTAFLSKPILRETLLEAVAKYAGAQTDAAPVSRGNRVEGDIESLVPAYLAKRRGDVAACRAALEGGNFDLVRKLGHNMKGTGSGYGLPRITELGGELEASALRSDASAIRNHLDRLASFVEEVP